MIINNLVLEKIIQKEGEYIMTTIVNTPAPAENSGNNMGMIIGLFVLIILGYLFFSYGLPAIQNVRLGTPTINPQINIPGKIDVTVNQPK